MVDINDLMSLAAAFQPLQTSVHVLGHTPRELLPTSPSHPVADASAVAGAESAPVFRVEGRKQLSHSSDGVIVEQVSCRWWLTGRRQPVMAFRVWCPSGSLCAQARSWWPAQSLVQQLLLWHATCMHSVLGPVPPNVDRMVDRLLLLLTVFVLANQTGDLCGPSAHRVLEKVGTH